ncbi:type IV pilus secretin PilQ [Ramlibacter sp. AW1]|uniref:Type IV pilus secretin PilQ n=1 Tax=Ramlibacter aurantiacus TaxID=2801330 RepID=A0A937D537_9BURK|nr:type IV pilus secretin PilQ [Ramlibacter aurantiacus]MBL0422330.1 type IV pilus secretin PilQ [Ramlibacter aurantiacus]
MKNKPIGAAWLPFLALAGVLLGAVGSPAAHAQGAPQAPVAPQAATASAAPLAVENISSSIQGGAEVVRIDFSQPLTGVPSGFTIQNPARIALDVPGARNALGRNTVDINQGNLRSVSVVQAGDRTRLVLNLKAATAYKAQVQGRALLVALDPVPDTNVASTTAPFAESRNRDTQPIKDIDFRRGTDSAGRVVVELLNNQVGVDIKQQGQTLVVEFLRSSLPEGLRRRLDVTDFGTPVQTVTTTQSGDRVRMVIQPSGQWEHSAYQSDNQFVVEVRQRKVDPNRLSQGPGYTGEKLSLNFQNIDVRALLQVIADFTNFNVVTSDAVTGSVTLRLKDVPWDQALDIILQAKGLGVRKVGNVLWIAPKEEIAAKEKLELEANAAIQGLEPVRTQAFQLNYTRAATVAAQLTAGPVANRMLSTRGSVMAEPRTNQLFVTDIPSRLEQVQSLIAKLDIPVRQVLIEARIVEAADTFGKSLGIRLGGSDLRAIRGGDAGYSLGGGNRVAFGGTYNAVSGTTGEGNITLDTVNTNFVNLPAVGLAGFNAPSFAISLFSSAANRFLNLELSALEADGKGKLVSSPRIVTADQTKALIEQGTEFPYQQATASGATAVAFRRATLKLEVTPQITPEGNIILDLDINKDSRGETTAAGIAINTKHIRTQVLVENGGTVVIGGIFELTETENEARVPVLGELPGVGNLFKNRQRTANKQEMLVFITPKMITDRTAAR